MELRIDCSSAAWAAHDLCGRNHRNISLRNIIIVKKYGKCRVGYLINWELSKQASTKPQAVRMYARPVSPLNHYHVPD